ncbi:MAG: DUF262 domain-containing protein [Deltaproteobacteria bacterium]|nr:DUF262 domain-containing protein [Deltaproteobacteria bacterium]
MKVYKKPWPLKTIYGIKDRIDTNPDFQRPAVWGQSQKQLLIDSILRDYDVPKIYWRKTGTKPDTYDVVDGQQRLRAIWEFFDGKYKLPKDADPADGFEIASCKYIDLPDDLRMKLDIYPLDIIILEETDEDEVREMFLRLQNGTTLKAQEKRNAFPGKMRGFVRNLSEHNFFLKVGFSNARYTYDLIIAQMACLELAGGPTNVKNADLNKMYEDNKEFDDKSSEAKAINKVLNFLNEVFSEKTPELERFNVISLYCVVAELMKQYIIDEIKPYFQNWVINFEQERHTQEAKPEDEADSEWVTYKEKISHSTDSTDSIRWRMEFMLRNLLEKYPNLSLKDNQREFTHVQKIAIFRRDRGICKLGIKCGGVKLTWDGWHCDHNTPWSKGGKTTVENGQVSCAACNLSKNNTIIQPITKQST